ncbi:MAG: DUF1795 domain-containing protein [candidate division Zixibacteria bacterium]|nr:DUF1795 domain-containing protein [candidate division Zixibacteria bacterium]
MQISLPDGWQDRTFYTYVGPEDNGVLHTLTLVVEPDSGIDDLEVYARSHFDDRIASLQGVDVLKDEEKTLPNGTPVYEFVYKWMPDENTMLLQKLVYMLVGETGYCFMANFSRKTIKTVGLQVDQIIASFVPPEPD